MDPHGQYDGYQAFFCRDIYLVEYDNAYLSELEALRQEKTRDPFSADEASNLFNYLLKYAMNERRRIVLQLHDSGYDDVVGFIKEMDDDFVLIQVSGRTDQQDGYALCRLSAVTMIICEEKRDAEF